MASSSKFNHNSCSFNLLSVLFIALLLVASTSATRPGTMMNLNEDVSMGGYKKDLKTSFEYRGKLFNFFPKWVPIPPSGPSKGHNSVVDSVPPN
ncbi:hypothetical protein SLE2022_219380 [Rubroshorea leprosula]